MKEIFDNMVNIFEDYDINYTEEGCNKIIDLWKENKKPLIELLSKHPNWNPDKYYISFDTDWDREPDMNIVYNFREWMHSKIPYEKFIKFSSLFYYSEQYVSENMADSLNRYFPELKIRKGMKTSKVMRKILLSLGFSEENKEEDGEEVRKRNREFRQMYSDYSDAINPLKIKRHTVISVNLIDYLLSSNGNSWSSCHTLDKNDPNGYSGQNCSGTLSYALDGSTIVFYQVDKEYDGNDLELQPKIIRQMFHYQNGRLVQGRLYPQCNDGKNSLYIPTREIMQRIVAGCLGEPNLWLRKKGTTACRAVICSTGTHYRDYIYNSECSVSTLMSMRKEDNLVHVGHRPICPYCGEEHDRTGKLNCDDHSDLFTCPECGRVIESNDNVIYVGDVPYHEDCVYYCEECHMYQPASEVSWYDSVDMDICNDCVDTYFGYCYNCVDLVRRENMIEDVYGELYCQSCAEENLTEIQGEYYPNKEVSCCVRCGEYFVGDGKICPNCMEEEDEES